MPAVRIASLRLPAALVVSGCGIVPVATIQPCGEPNSMSYERPHYVGHLPIVDFIGDRWL
ncbi:MAG TPA: hypothetical protein VGM00_14110 [Bradyrhizobium sp.]|jgi:hypothetical protein